MARAEALETRKLCVQPVSHEQISNRSFEVVELCKIFGGPKLHSIYMWIFLVYLMTTSWAYAFVFAEALSTTVPVMGMDVCLPDEACPLYRFYAGVFLVLAVPLSLLEPREQTTFQITMTGLRVLVAAAMSTTA